MRTSEQSPNPFPGLRPFEFPESHLFFGREGQSKELLHKLRLNRFVAVVGTSGSGKSSLVRAGLLPLLHRGFMRKPGPSWRIALFRPGKDPLFNLARALNAPESFGAGYGIKQQPAGKPAGQEEKGALDEEAIKTAATETILRRSARGLAEHVRRTRVPKEENLLVIVDQFEELFRFKEKSDATNLEDEAAAFVKLLLEAVHEQELPIYVVLTMRSDFLGDCAQFRDLPEAINESQYLIPRMTRDQQRSAIVRPALDCGAEIAPRLVQRLLNDVGDNPDHLPILQHALMRTWDYWKGDGAGREIDLQHYEAIGTMSQALSMHADEAYQELPDARSKRIAEKLFKALTVRVENRREVRRPTELRDICKIAEAEAQEVIAIIENFRREGRSFLMPPPGVELSDESLIDISHESLIWGWDVLKKWVEEEAKSARVYQFVADAAERYRDDQASLLRAADLKFALEWRDKADPNEVWARRYRPGLRQALDFIKASEIQRDKELADEERLRQEQLERERHEHAIEQALEEAKLHRAEEAKLRAEEAKLRAEAEAARAEEAKRAAEIEARAHLRESENAHKLAEEQMHLAIVERRSARRLRIVVAALIIMVLVAGATAVYAIAKRLEAEKEKNHANQEQARAETEKQRANENELQAIDSAKRASESEAAEKKAADIARENARKELIARKRADQERARADRQTQLALIREGYAKSAQQRAIEALDEAVVSKQEAVNAAERERAARIAADKANSREGLNREALLSLQMGELDDAENKFNDALQAYQGDQKPDGQSWILYNLGALYREKNDYTKAEEMYKSSIEMLERVYGAGAQKTLASRDRLAHLYQEQGKYLEAEKNYQQAMGILKSPSSRSNATYLVRIMSDTADLYRTQAKDIAVRLKQQEREIAAMLNEIGPVDNNQSVGVILAEPTMQNLRKTVNDIAAYCLNPDYNFTQQCQQYNDSRKTQGEKIEQALAYYNDVLSVSERSLPPNHPSLATLYTNLGQVYQEQGKANIAIKLFSLASTIRYLNEASSSPSQLSIENLEMLASAYFAAKRFNQAETLYLKVLEEARMNAATTPGNLRNAVLQTARIYRWKKDYDKAERYYKEALSTPEDNGSSFSQNNFYSIDYSLDYELGGFYQAQKKYAEAVVYYERDIGRQRERVRAKPILRNQYHLADRLSLLARFYNQADKVAEAINSSKEALDIMTNAVGPNNPALSEFLHGLAESYHKQNNLGEAERFYIRTRQVLKELMETEKRTPSNPDGTFTVKVDKSFSLILSPVDYANDLADLASLYSSQKRFQEAEALYKEALSTLDVFSKRFSPIRDDISESYIKRDAYTTYSKSFKGYAELLRKVGRQQEAIESENHAKEFEALLKKLNSKDQDEDSDP